MFIIIFPYKFTKSFYYDFQINELRKNLMTSFEVHDLSYIVNKEWRKAFTGKRNKFVKEFKTIQEWKKNIEKKIKKNKKIYILNFLDTNTFNSLLLHRILNKKEIFLIQLRSPGIQLNKKKFFNEIVKIFFYTLFFNFKRFLFLFKQSLFSKIIKFIKYENLAILYVGKKKHMIPYLRASNTFFIKYNSSDYFNYLSYKKKKKSGKDKIIFLDSNAPFISDKKLFKYNINYDVTSWYESLNKFLLNLQKKLRLKVVIIPHPRSRDKNNKFYSSKLKVAKDENATLRYIKDAKVVFAISATTAASFCVIFNKPINFIYNNQIKEKNSDQFNHMLDLSKSLGTKFINLENKISKHDINFKIKKNLYKKYKYDYLTSKETENKKIYEILNNNFFKI